MPIPCLPQLVAIMKSLTLDVSGMTCEHCSCNVKRALEAVAGVRVENVKQGSAKVEFDPSLTNPGAIADAVTEAGYPAHAAHVTV